MTKTTIALGGFLACVAAVGCGGPEDVMARARAQEKSEAKKMAEAKNFFVCDPWSRLANDVKAGIVSDSELRARFQADVYKHANVVDEATREHMTGLLAGLTRGNAAQVTAEAQALTVACHPELLPGPPDPRTKLKPGDAGYDASFDPRFRDPRLRR
jgi:hypothetical protein